MLTMFERVLDAFFLGSMVSLTGIWATFLFIAFLILGPFHFLHDIYSSVLVFTALFVFLSVVAPILVAFQWWNTKGRFGVSLF